MEEYAEIRQDKCVQTQGAFLENQVMILKYFSCHKEDLVLVLKEFIIYMIVNLSRVYHDFFKPTLQLLKHRLEQN